MADQKKQKLPNWDLTDLYPSPDSPEFKKDMSKAAAEAQRFEKHYKGKLAGLSPDQFGTAIEEYEGLSETLGKMGTYSYLLRSTNLNDPKVMGFYQNVEEKSNDIGTKTLFFGLEINKMSDKQIEEKMSSEKAAKYSPWLKQVRAMKDHMLSDDVEEILHEKSVTGASAWVRLYDETSAKLTYNVDGKEYTDAEISNLTMSEDPEIRAKAGKEMGRVSTENAPLFSHIMNTLVKDKAIEDEKRGFKKPVSSRNVENQVEDEVVDALVGSVHESQGDLSHRYYKLKANWLGKDKLDYWDRNAPLPFAEEPKYSWEEAKKTVIDAYTEFSPEIAEVGKDFFENDWIDVGPKKGKDSGAYAHPCVPSAHPYIMLNYQGKPDDVMTLAHELGHGVHQQLAKKQGALMADTPLTLAETASVFGEMITFQSMVKKEKDPKKKLALLAGKVESMINTSVRQVAFHDFETKVHSERKKGEVSTEKLGEHWKDVQKSSLGDGVKIDDNSKDIWGQIPHVFHTPFYVYAYAFGDNLVNSLYSVHKEGKVEDFPKKYKEMLSKGGTEGHKKLLKPFGLDASDPKFWKKGLNVISEMIDQVEELSDQLGLTKDASKTPSATKKAKAIKQAKAKNGKKTKPLSSQIVAKKAAQRN